MQRKKNTIKIAVVAIEIIIFVTVASVGIEYLMYLDKTI